MTRHRKSVGISRKIPGRTTILVALASALLLTILTLASVRRADAHIIPPERYHPSTESYLRMNFMLNLNPVRWEEVRADSTVISDRLGEVNASEGISYRSAVDELIDSVNPGGDGAATTTPREHRIRTARGIFEHSTRAVARTLTLHLQTSERTLGNYSDAAREVSIARQLWESFTHEVKSTDRPGFMAIGRSWLHLSSALGSPGVLDVGAIAPDVETFHAQARAIIAYVEANFGDPFRAPETGPLAPLPRNSGSFDPSARVPARLPPGNNMNKQVPRPRQILNMATRGVDEAETPLIALGDMAFDSAYIFGEPARTFSLSCNTCHNKGVTNPLFEIPGISGPAGSLDVSNSFFAPHANNAHFDPLDIPDLRGIRFTAPYGRNGRFASLREFVRNVIVNEFNGEEPDPLLLDGMIAYMNEFDFLPNPQLNPDGTLSQSASASAKRGEQIFGKEFASMGGRSCATCHVPSDHFVDHKRHDIETVGGSEPYSLDRALDTPTLLSARFTGPYFHDGSQPTLRSVNEWFNDKFELGLNNRELDDLTAYVEAVGDGLDSYEDSPFYLDAELEEFSFFLAAFDFLKAKNKPDLMGVTFQTVSAELSNHMWELQELEFVPIMEELAVLMDAAYAASLAGDIDAAGEKVDEYRRLFAANVDNLR